MEAIWILAGLLGWFVARSSRSSSGDSKMNYLLAEAQVKLEWMKDPDYWKEDMRIGGWDGKADIYNKFGEKIFTEIGLSWEQKRESEKLKRELAASMNTTVLRMLDEPRYYGTLDERFEQAREYLKNWIWAKAEVLQWTDEEKLDAEIAYYYQSNPEARKERDRLREN